MNRDVVYYETDDEEHNSSTSNENNDESDDSSSENDHDSLYSDTDSEDSTDEVPWYWENLVDEANDRLEENKKQIVEKRLANGETEEDAEINAHNELLPILRKELRNILLDRLVWMHAIKRDSYFKKIMRTRQELLDSGDYGWLEAAQLAIHQRKFLLDDLIPYQKIDIDSSEDEETTEINHEVQL